MKRKLLIITVFSTVLSPLAQADRLCDTGMWRLLANTANENGLNWSGGLADCKEESINGLAYYQDQITGLQAIVFKQPTRVQFTKEGKALFCAKIENAKLKRTSQSCN